VFIKDDSPAGEGKNIRGDILGAIIADIVAEKGNIIIYDLRCSKAIPEYFKEKGVIAIPSKVGHYNIKNLMRVKDAVFGMELSGHLYFKEFNFAESPEYALRIIKEHLYKKPGLKISDLAKKFEKYFHSGVINLKVKNPDEIIEKLKKQYKDAKQSQLDGLTVEYPDFWFNTRKSHTEPILRLVVEANTQEMLDKKKKELVKIIGA
jgi:phosphomannomutase